jgi:perosamine synthetase
MDKLALFGGTAIIPGKGVSEDRWPITTDEDRKAVDRVFESGHFVGLHDPEVEALEKEYAEYVGTEYAMGFGTGTSSLHAAVAASGIKPGEEVIVPALTFLASATAVLQQLGLPVFADIDPVTYNIDPASVEVNITERTRAIMAVDMHGLPADYPALQKIAKKHNLMLISDAAHSMGAVQNGKRSGSLADVTGTSIMPAKQWPTCGEGGFLSTDQVEIFNLAGMVRMFGEVIEKDKPRSYNAFTLGYNYRLNPVQAAYARSQLTRLNDNILHFQKNAEILTNGLKELPGIIPPYIPNGSTHAYHMYRIRFDPKQMGLDVDFGRFTKAIELAMEAEGLPLRFYQNIPVPGQVLFKMKEGFGNGVPWTLPGTREINYSIEDYPITLDVLENTRCIGRSGTSGPNYFLNQQTIELYLQSFQKLWKNLSQLEKHAKEIDYKVPWSNFAPSTRGVWTIVTPKTAKA